jgi:hypothetical protein
MIHRLISQLLVVVFVFNVLIFWLGSTKGRSYPIPRVRKVWSSLIRLQSEDEDAIHHKEEKKSRLSG